MGRRKRKSVNQNCWTCRHCSGFRDCTPSHHGQPRASAVLSWRIAHIRHGSHGMPDYQAYPCPGWQPKTTPTAPTTGRE